MDWATYVIEGDGLSLAGDGHFFRVHKVRRRAKRPFLSLNRSCRYTSVPPATTQVSPNI
jgi:hypothetical protein